MKKLKRILYGLIILAVAVTMAHAEAASPGSDKETDRMLRAKDYVFERSWEKAKDQLEIYLQAYPEGQHQDEALYWLAQSLNKLSRKARQATRVISLKEKAINRLNSLITEYPESMWLDDGKTLKIELSAELVLMGKNEHKAYIEDVISAENKDMSDVKIVALNRMIELEPEAAIPVLETIIREEKDPSIRKKGVYLLGRHYPDEVSELLAEIEETDPDQTVREEATYWNERSKVHRLPVQLNYFCYMADLTPGAIKRLKEDEVNVFKLPRVQSSNKVRVEDAITEYFDDKVTNMTFVSNGVRGAAYWFLDTVISHRVNGYRVQLIDDSLTKGLDEISGKVRFYDLKNEKEYVIPFTVDELNEDLIVMAQDGHAALMLLQFESTEEELDLADEPIYSTEFSNVLGCVVYSSRQGWTMSEMSKRKSLIDYGRARAEIPGEQGKWTLTGNILLNRDERVFIGRHASLVDPKGKTVAEAPKIVVPIDRPAKYQITP